MAQKRVAIIGGGPSGICAARFLKNKHDVTVFEKQSGFGGAWKYYPKPAAKYFTQQNDHYPKVLPYEQVNQSPMYHDLRCNAPKELMCFHEFRMDNALTGSFPSYKETLKYLQDYAKHFDIEPLVKFNTAVHSVERSDASPYASVQKKDKWLVTHGLKNGTTNDEFDAVVVASGHHDVGKPLPFTLHADFKGPVLHSKYFDMAEDFKDKTVLILGALSSGTDIASRVAPVCKHLVWAVSSQPASAQQKEIALGFVEESARGKVVFVDPVTAVGADGALTTSPATSSAPKVDAIINATGYLHTFPFFSDEYIPELHKLPNGGSRFALDLGTFSSKYPTSLAFLGIQWQYLPMAPVEMQCRALAAMFDLDAADYAKNWLPTVKKVDVPANWRGDFHSNVSRYVFAQMLQDFGGGDLQYFKTAVQQLSSGENVLDPVWKQVDEVHNEFYGARQQLGYTYRESSGWREKLSFIKPGGSPDSRKQGGSASGFFSSLLKAKAAIGI